MDQSLCAGHRYSLLTALVCFIFDLSRKTRQVFFHGGPSSCVILLLVLIPCVLPGFVVTRCYGRMRIVKPIPIS